MSLAKKFGWNFGTSIRSRGKRLLKSGAISKILKNEGETYLEATVVGTSKYRVIYDFVDGLF